MIGFQGYVRLYVIQCFMNYLNIVCWKLCSVGDLMIFFVVCLFVVRGKYVSNFCLLWLVKWMFFMKLKMDVVIGRCVMVKEICWVSQRYLSCGIIFVLLQLLVMYSYLVCCKYIFVVGWCWIIILISECCGFLVNSIISC